MHTGASHARPRSRLAFLLALLVAVVAPACGGGDNGPFVETPPPPSDDPVAAPTSPPPEPPPGAWQPNALSYGRTAFFGSFPSGLVRHGDTLFASDADQIEGGGAQILAIDVSGPAPASSTRFPGVTIVAGALVDSAGAAADLADPIGFGFFLNEILIVSDTLGFVLVNAGGSDSTPTLSNLLAFDPSTGSVLQTVDLATVYAPGRALFDSAGNAVPGGAFRQAGAEGLEYVPTADGGLLYVAMSNLIFGAPSFGADKYPGTVQVFDVDPSAREPVAPKVDPVHATRVLPTQAYNPVAVTHISAFGANRVLVTCAGTTAFDASFDLVPVTNSAVEVFDAASGALEGRFLLGLAGLSGIRPALGRDAAGHLVGFFPSAVTGEVYLLRLDGLTGPFLDASRLDVLRGPDNGIPITAALAGSPGGNISGVALAPDGRTLVVSGFGDVFSGQPGRVFLLALPSDLRTGAGFGTDFTPGSTTFGTAVGRTTGEIVILPSGGTGPDVYVNVAGPVDPVTGLGTGAASLGTLDTGGLIR